MRRPLFLFQTPKEKAGKKKMLNAEGVFDESFMFIK
jgi:hypothetical protein